MPSDSWWLLVYEKLAKVIFDIISPPLPRATPGGRHFHAFPFVWQTKICFDWSISMFSISKSIGIGIGMQMPHQSAAVQPFRQKKKRKKKKQMQLSVTLTWLLCSAWRQSTRQTRPGSWHCTVNRRTFHTPNDSLLLPPHPTFYKQLDDPFADLACSDVCEILSRASNNNKTFLTAAYQLSPHRIHSGSCWGVAGRGE